MVQPFNDIASQYDLLNDFLSLGLHRLWKKRLVHELLESKPNPDRVLDIATGTGDLAALLAEKISPTAIWGLDPSLAMMETGKAKYPFLKNWIQGSAEAIPFAAKELTLITCTFGVRNFQDRLKAFSEIARVLKSGGLLGIIEIHPIPEKLVYFPLRLFWNYVVPALGAFFKKKTAYEYLRDTGAGFISCEVMIKELAKDFKLRVRRTLIPGGLVSFLIFEKR
ncbi:MAG: ubiquinone/menaquinone biosynthesis methyltransferase [Pseudomonadota bacterium]